MSDRFDQLLGQARELAGQRRGNEALATLEEALGYCGTDAGRLDRLAVLFRGLGERRRAIELFRRAILSEPENPRIAAQLGRSCFEAGAFVMATPCLRVLLWLVPGNDLAMSLLTVCLHRTGRGGAVERVARAALISNPTDDRVVRAMVAAWHDVGGENAAIGDWLDRAIVLNPGDLTVYMDAGIFHATAMRYPQAAHMFRRALRQQPDDAGAHFWLGRMLRAQGELVASAVELDRAVELNPAQQFEREILERTATRADFQPR